MKSVVDEGEISMSDMVESSFSGDAFGGKDKVKIRFIVIQHAWKSSYAIL